MKLPIHHCHIINILINPKDNITIVYRPVYNLVEPDAAASFFNESGIVVLYDVSVVLFVVGFFVVVFVGLSDADEHVSLVSDDSSLAGYDGQFAFKLHVVCNHRSATLSAEH
jgi:hypothetical protein